FLHTRPLSTLTGTATTDTHPLSLHDALPISRCETAGPRRAPAARPAARPGPNLRRRRECTDRRALRLRPATLGDTRRRVRARTFAAQDPRGTARGRPLWPIDRSEEHTSELQSRENLVCRLLLEKK